MKDEDILDKARMEGMNQGVWLSVQELAHDGRWTQAAEKKADRLMMRCLNLLIWYLVIRI